jgi:hypothetical protein
MAARDVKNTSIIGLCSVGSASIDISRNDTCIDNGGACGIENSARYTRSYLLAAGRLRNG